VYYCFIAIALVLLAGELRRKLLFPAIVPLLLLMTLYGKNYFHFGNFGASTFGGMVVWLATGEKIAEGERRRLVDEGKLSELAMIEAASGLRRFPERFVNVEGYENIPALREGLKSTGAINFNHLAYIGISNQYYKDSLYIMLHYPKEMLIEFMKSWYDYFKSATDHGYLQGNKDKIPTMTGLYDRVLYAKVRIGGGSKTPGEPTAYHVYLTLLIGLPLVLIYGLRWGLDPKSSRIGLDSGDRLLILYMCFNIVFVAVLGNLLSSAETNRYRFLTDPFYAILGGVFLQHLVVRRLGAAIRSRHGV
jgi:hypothetical protein